MPANYVLLERIELNATTASVTFNNIPQSGYTDLKVVVSARGTTSNINDLMKIQFNGSTANFTTRWIQGNSSTASSGNDTTGRIGYMPDVASTASTFGNAEIYIPNYLGSTNKSYSTDAVQENNSGTAGEALVNLFAGLWSQTAAINSVTLTGTNGNFAANSTFSLYGLAALGTTPVIAPKASGGNIIDFDGTYWIHTFNTTGAFVPQTGLTCDYLVVAGGGGAGGNWYSNWGNGTGGGGGGGLRSTVTATGGGGSLESPLSLTATNYTVTVGAGGAGGSVDASGNSRGGTIGSNGSNSVFSTITATGGGGGGGGYYAGGTGALGGSGGGGWNAQSVGNGGAGTANQGYAGGNGVSSGGGAGGGGAAAVGSNAINTGAGGAGGAGVATSISGTSVTYAGGGGGGSSSSGQLGGAGGAGGGGAGNTTNGNAGTVNTGGGGGGVGTNTTLNPGNAGAGGSGVVIVRYLKA